METNRPRFPEKLFPGQLQKERICPWLLLQAQFIGKKWHPAMGALGLNTDQSMRLWSKWFAPLGSIYKETEVSPDYFQEALETFLEKSMAHLNNLKLYLSQEHGFEVSWNEVVQRIEGAMPTDLIFFMQSGKVFTMTEGDERPAAHPDDKVRSVLYDVYLPNVLTAGEARLRIPFSCVRAEILQHPVLEVTDGVTQETRYLTHRLIA